MKNILTGLCGLLAGGILTLAATEPRTHASIDPTPVIIPEATPVIVTPVITPDETAPPLVPSVTQDAIALAPAFVATSSDCPGGVCSQPRAIVRQRVMVQKPQRRGLFGGRFRR